MDKLKAWKSLSIYQKENVAIYCGIPLDKVEERINELSEKKLAEFYKEPVEVVEPVVEEPVVEKKSIVRRIKELKKSKKK